jgi:predicted MFS family arabinose efflux permease
MLALAALGWLTLPLLAILGFFGACGTVAYGVAAPSLVPALVGPTQLARANSRIELARTAAFAGGPAIAGALVGWIGASPAFGLAAGLSILAVFLLAGLREPAREIVKRATTGEAVKQALSRDVWEGARFVIGHSLLLPVFATQAIFNTAFFVLQAAYVPYAIHMLGLSASGVGATLATYGAGLVTGALLAPIAMRTLRFGLVVAIGPIVGLGAALVMVLTAWVPSAIVPSALLAGLSFFLFGVGPILWTISTTTLRQTVTPPELLGRVSAISTLTWGARPIGALIGAVVGGLYGAQACLIVAAGGFAIQAVLIVLSPARRLATQPQPTVSRPTLPGQISA